MNRRKKRAAEINRGWKEPKPEISVGSPGRVDLGDVVTRRPVTFGSGVDNPGRDRQTGRVVYIHPLDRFHVVEFNMGLGRSIRESFHGVDR